MTTRRSGSIRQLAPGKFAIRCQIGEGLNGSRRTLSKTVLGNKTDAERALGELLQQAGAAGAGQRLKDAATLWVKARKRRVSAGSWERCEQLIRRSQEVVPGLFSMKVADVLPRHIDEALVTFAEQGRDMKRPNAKAGDLAPRTVLQLRGFLRQIFDDCVRDRTIQINPVTLSRPVMVEDSEARALTTDELPIVLGYFNEASTLYRALFSLLLGTGMRRGEALALTWGDVDLSTGSLSINKAIKRADGKYFVGATKTAKSKRRITMPAFIVEALQAHRDHLRAMLGVDVLSASLWVFGSPNDPAQFLNPGTVTSYFRAASKRLSIDAGSPVHCLRHTHATTLLGQIPLASLAARLGHSKPTTTLAIYSHAIAEMDDAAALAAEVAHNGLSKTRTSNVVPMPQKSRGTRRAA